jgi:hypothetical protein
MGGGGVSFILTFRTPGVTSAKNYKVFLLPYTVQ